MKLRLTTLLVLVWSIVLQAVANMGVAGGVDYTLCASLGNDGAPYITAPAGLQTGLWAATDDGGGVSEVYWYDRNGRKAYESIDTGPGRVCRAMRYNYAGQQNEDYELVYDKTVLPWKSWRVQRNISYDNAGRIATEKTKLDTCTVITNYTYDGAERLSRTVTGLLEESAMMLGGTMSSDNVRRDYYYDVHGWPVKIVTAVPLEKAPVFPGTLEISTPYYEAASASSLPQLSLLKKEYTETIHYADGANPRYNGTPSARGLTQGGRYDYRYDELDRLIAADYTAPSGTPDADFSTEYTYDILSRLTSIKRHGVVDIDGDTEVFGMLDDITLTYSGAVLARMQSNITEETGREFYGRTGWSKGTFMPSATVSYNAAGRLCADGSRMLGAVSYNTIGLPTCYSIATGSSASTSPRKERCYDATGRKLRQTEYEAVRGKMTKTSDRRYVGSMTFNADTLERVDFTGGYFDGRGAAHYLFTDWQGNVTITTDAAGKIEQHIGYYPYGEPWREPSGQRATLFAGKERLSGQAAGDFDFGPRGYRPTIAYWDSPDRLAHKTPGISPWAYCAGNPIRYNDQTGYTPEEYYGALMSGAVYQDNEEEYNKYIAALKEGDWYVSSNVPENVKLNSPDGFKSMLFEKRVDGKVTEYCYAFAGTDKFNAKDWLQNGLQGIGLSTQYMMAVNNADKLKQALGNKLTFVGHSLGAGLATAAGLKTGLGVLAFNPAALSNDTKRNLHLPSDGANITNYITTVVTFNLQVPLLDIPLKFSIAADPLYRLQRKVGMSFPGNKEGIPIGFKDPIKSHSIQTIIEHLQPRNK